MLQTSRIICRCIIRKYIRIYIYICILILYYYRVVYTAVFTAAAYKSKQTNGHVRFCRRRRRRRRDGGGAFLYGVRVLTRSKSRYCFTTVRYCTTNSHTTLKILNRVRSWKKIKRGTQKCTGKIVGTNRKEKIVYSAPLPKFKHEAETSLWDVRNWSG